MNKLKLLIWIFVFFTLIATASAAVNTANVIQSLDFNGDYTDSSPNGNDSTNQGTSLAAGLIGQAADGEGETNGDYVDTNINFNTELGGFSINFWMKSDSANLAADADLVGSGGTGDDDWFVRTEADTDTINFGYFRHSTNGIVGKINGTTDVFDQTWHMITIIYNDTNEDMFLYVDGVMEGSDLAVNLDASGAGTWNPLTDIASHSGGVALFGRFDNAGTDIDFDGLMDMVTFWEGYTLDEDNDIAGLWNGGAGLEYSNFAGSTPAANFTVSAYDVWDGTPIENFSAKIDGGTAIADENNTVYTSILQNDTGLHNITYTGITDNGGYFNQTYLNVNVSSNFNGSLHQAEIRFNATLVITNASVTGVFNYSSHQNTTFFVKAGTPYNFTFYNSSYFAKTQEFTFTAFENATKTIENVSGTRLNITAKHFFDNATIQNFNGWVEDENIQYNTTFNVTNGEALVSYLQGYNVTVFIRAENWSNDNLSLTINDSVENVTFYLYRFNSFFVRFFDEESKSLIDYKTILLELISDVFSNNYSTPNGTLYLTVLDPANYTARYKGDNNNPTSVVYPERVYFFELNNNTYNTVDLFLLNYSNEFNITIQVLDQNANYVNGAIIKALRYEITDNTYDIVSMDKTDVNGNAVLRVSYDDEFYKFIVEYGGETLKITEPAYIQTDTYSIQVIIGETAFENFYEWFNLENDLTFNTATNNFRFTWNDVNGVSTAVRLRVYKVDGSGATLVNSTSSSSASGTLLRSVGAVNGTTYEARAYYVDGSGNEYMLDEEQYTFPESDIMGNLGLFLQIAITLVFALMFLWSPSVASVAVPLTLIFGRIAHLNILPWWVLIVIQLIGIILALALSEKR